MTNPFENENGEFIVLVNHEGQYSLWPTFKEIPAGWSAAGPRGKKKECLDWVEANWTKSSQEPDRGNEQEVIRAR